MFMLVLLLDHQSIKKTRWQNNLIWLIYPSNFEIVFALLAKTVAF